MINKGSLILVMRGRILIDMIQESSAEVSSVMMESVPIRLNRII